jgi:ribosomal protein S18 acetylase RimI-like enzyme
MTLRIENLSGDDPELQPLREEAAREGYQFLERLAANWASGRNRFNLGGEALVGGYLDDHLVAVAGINREPYEPLPRTARLRHVYVLPEFRRRGVARDLVTSLLEHAGGDFDAVQLRTDTPAAARFYEQLGFERIEGGTSTHRIILESSSAAGRSSRSPIDKSSAPCTGR